MSLRVFAFAAALLISMQVAAHRLSPAYFGMIETSPDRWSVQWKVSISGGLSDVLEPQLPQVCSVEGNVRRFTVDDARVMHASFVCDSELPGQTFAVSGLEATQTDVLLRIEYLDGQVFTHRLVPESVQVAIPAAPGWGELARTWFVLGVEHIWFGIDHLLFVLALVMLVRGWRSLVATITAFTVAHSITLGGAAVGFVSVPSAPVEAIIALSILFLATELARRQAVPTRPQSIADRSPWLVAFAFGLLHGFGFAGALSEIGLPANGLVSALLFFNLGVEIGQLVFVAGILLVMRAAALLPRAVIAPVPRLATYVLGTVSAMWLIERTITNI